MDKKTILKDYRKKYHIYNEEYSRIDSNIQPLVDWFRKQGFITFASCGSHIFSHDGVPVLFGQAYVAFYYADEDKELLDRLQKIKLPHSKRYQIIWDPLTPDEKDARMAFNIFFNTRYNRIRDFKKIYDALGVSYPPDMKLEKYRLPLKKPGSRKFNIYKSGVNMV